jgi:hypothetical protein
MTVGSRCSRVEEARDAERGTTVGASLGPRGALTQGDPEGASEPPFCLRFEGQGKGQVPSGQGFPRVLRFAVHRDVDDGERGFPVRALSLFQYFADRLSSDAFDTGD